MEASNNRWIVVGGRAEIFYPGRLAFTCSTSLLASVTFLKLLGCFFTTHLEFLSCSVGPRSRAGVLNTTACPRDMGLSPRTLFRALGSISPQRFRFPSHMWTSLMPSQESGDTHCCCLQCAMLLWLLQHGAPVHVSLALAALAVTPHTLRALHF